MRLFYLSHHGGVIRNYRGSICLALGESRGHKRDETARRLSKDLMGQSRKGKMTKRALLLGLFLLVTVLGGSASAQRKPKLGSGTASGVVDRQTVCGNDQNYLCVRVGSQFLLQLEVTRSTAIVGSKLLKHGQRARVTYVALRNSEMDRGRVFTGRAKRILLISR
jgi:hypothetical protein